MAATTCSIIFREYFTSYDRNFGWEANIPGEVCNGHLNGNLEENLSSALILLNSFDEVEQSVAILPVLLVSSLKNQLINRSHPGKNSRRIML